MRGIAAVKPGARTGDIGAAIQTYAEAERCSRGARLLRPRRRPAVPRRAQHPALRPRRTKAPEMREGMIFTIEPMINLGRPHVKVLSDGWTAVTRDRSLSAQYEHTVGVTATGCEIFTLSPGGLDRPGLPSLKPPHGESSGRSDMLRPGQTSAGPDEDERGFFAEQAARAPRRPRPGGRPTESSPLSRPSRAAARALRGTARRLACRLRTARTAALPARSRARDTKPLAKALLARFGSLAGVLGAPPALLQEVEGHRRGRGARPEARSPTRRPRAR